MKTIEATEEAQLYAEISRMWPTDLTGPLDLSLLLVYFGVKEPLFVTDVEISETYDLAAIAIENCNDRPFFALAESGDAKGQISLGNGLRDKPEWLSQIRVGSWRTNDLVFYGAPEYIVTQAR